MSGLAFVYHSIIHGTACFALVVAVLILANVVMTDLDNPPAESTTSIRSYSPAYGKARQYRRVLPREQRAADMPRATRVRNW